MTQYRHSHKKLLVFVLVVWNAAATLPRSRWGVAASVFSTSSPSATSEESCSNEDSESVLRHFVQQHKPDCQYNFKIQGWRWHTMSLLREASRLASALSLSSTILTTTTDDDDDFQTVTDYIVNFNMRGLHRIQHDLFFPWVRKEIQTRCLEPTVKTAFSSIMTQLEKQQNQVERLGKQLHSQISRNSIDQAARTTATLAATVQSMLQTEDALLVPVVAHFIPVREQVSFNTKVVRSLGVWDSRLHLVGMHEAVIHYQNKKHDDGNTQAAAREYASFQNEIPYLPRMMIPRWKRSLYDPKVAVLLKHEETTTVR